MSELRARLKKAERLNNAAAMVCIKIVDPYGGPNVTMMVAAIDRRAP